MTQKSKLIRKTEINIKRIIYSCIQDRTEKGFYEVDILKLEKRLLALTERTIKIAVFSPTEEIYISSKTGQNFSNGPLKP